MSTGSPTIDEVVTRIRSGDAGGGLFIALAFADGETKFVTAAGPLTTDTLMAKLHDIGTEIIRAKGEKKCA